MDGIDLLGDQRECNTVDLPASESVSFGCFSVILTTPNSDTIAGTKHKQFLKKQRLLKTRNVLLKIT